MRTSVWWPIHLVSALRCKVVAGDAVRSGQGAHFSEVDAKGCLISLVGPTVTHFPTHGEAGLQLISMGRTTGWLGGWVNLI